MISNKTLRYKLRKAISFNYLLCVIVLQNLSQNSVGFRATHIMNNFIRWSSIATLDYKLIWVAPLLRTEKFIVVGNKIYGL